MVVWRICKLKWAASAFSGIGSAENPGRWNSEGHKAVYCGETRALAAWEVSANTSRKRSLRHARFVAIPVEVPDGLIVRPARFPADWAQTPTPDSTRKFGDHFLLSGKAPVLRVPSVTVKGEFCFLLNPEHPEFKALTIGKPEAFVFDGRAIADYQPSVRLSAVSKSPPRSG